MATDSFIDCARLSFGSFTRCANWSPLPGSVSDSDIRPFTHLWHHNCYLVDLADAEASILVISEIFENNEIIYPFRRCTAAYACDILLRTKGAESRAFIVVATTIWAFALPLMYDCERRRLIIPPVSQSSSPLISQSPTHAAQGRNENCGVSIQNFSYAVR